jgi:serine/threonine protein phosphatase 1
MLKEAAMAFIYAMSDIHGEIQAFREALAFVDLKNKENRLVLLGDYIGRRGDQTDALLFIKSLQEQFKKQVIVLMGNHELMLLDNKEMLDEWKIWAAQGLFGSAEPELDPKSYVFLRDEEEDGIISWLKSLPYYYETDGQIFVHAGVDEEAGEHWKWGAEDYYLCQKFPPTIGTFHKDIIAGHSSALKTYERFKRFADVYYDNGIFWDRMNHFIIDGETEKTKFVPVLKYDVDKGAYFGLGEIFEGSEAKWIKI